MSNVSPLHSSLSRLCAVGVAEGVSFLALLGVAMPLKYLLGMPLAVRVVGLIHGVLFIAFVYLVFEAMGSLRWSLKQVGVALIASLLPFGTIMLDRKLKREASAARGLQEL